MSWTILTAVWRVVLRMRAENVVRLIGWLAARGLYGYVYRWGGSRRPLDLVQAWLGKIGGRLTSPNRKR